MISVLKDTSEKVPLRGPVLIGVLVVVLASCADGSGTAGTEDRPSVVVAFFPLEEAVERIGGERVRVTNLTPPGAEPHDFELTTTALDEVLDADLVLYLGGGFQPALDDAVGRTTGMTVDLLEGLPLRTGEPHARDHGHDDDHGSSTDDAHEAGDEIVDPHVWLDPELWARVVERIEGVMADLDPAAAEDYRSAGAAYRGELEDLARAYEERLASCDRDLIVTTHASFGYLAERYGLRQEAISGLAPEAEPDPRRIADLIDLVGDEGVTTVFTEPLISPRVADTLAREAGVVAEVLDPVESSTEGTYLDAMRGNLGVLVEALGCR